MISAGVSRQIGLFQLDIVPVGHELRGDENLASREDNPNPAAKKRRLLCPGRKKSNVWFVELTRI